ncbi:MAG: TetR/AcrR family transcriptional regulator [Rhodococcus sp. (in: high G+C Gram-positive bacteria)]
MTVPSARADARRSELVGAASEVILTRGYRNCSVADITARAGVAHGTFYNYFDSRREVLDAVIEHEFGALVAEVIGDDQLEAAESIDAFVAQFARMLGRVKATVAQRPELIRFVLYDAAAVDQEVIARLLGLFDRISEYSAVFVRNGVAHGFLCSGIEVAVAADTITSVLSACALVVLRELENGGTLSPEANARTLEPYVDFVVHALT